jgi:hypothetical protein
MARRVAYGIVGLFVVFLVVLAVLPYVKRVFPTVSGFEDMSCEEGLKPCPEGYFCEQRTCVPILPRYDINNVKPNSGF